MVKEKSCLVTQALVGGVEWFLTAPSSIIKPDKGGDGVLTWKDKALQDLKNMLERIPGEFGEPAKRGILFEKKVYQYANEAVIPDKYSKEFKQVCNEVKGYQFFQKKGINVEIAGENCYLYAKFDAIKPPSIKDIKTTQSYSANKYLKGIQHEIYCYVLGAKDFEYIIAEWGEYPKIKAVYKERYVVEDINKLGVTIYNKVSETFSIIKDLGLWESYRTKYCLY